MKIDDLVERIPWKETREVLFADPPAAEQLPVGRAERLISQQRGSQVEVVVRLMLSPVLASEPPREDARAGTGSPDEPRYALELRDARRTARLVVDRAARAGKDLYEFRVEDLDKLHRSDALLGRLLQLLAIAQKTSRAERRKLLSEWRAIIAEPADLGVVLTPMVQSKAESADVDVGTLAGALMQSLEHASRPGARRISYRTLLPWTASLVREGSLRLRELGADWNTPGPADIG